MISDLKPRFCCSVPPPVTCCIWQCLLSPTQSLSTTSDPCICMASPCQPDASILIVGAMPQSKRRLCFVEDPISTDFEKQRVMGACTIGCVNCRANLMHGSSSCSLQGARSGPDQATKHPGLSVAFS